LECQKRNSGDEKVIMNPALLIIVLIVLVALWFLLSFLFRPMGKFAYRIYKDAVDEINKKEEKSQEEKENE